MTPDIRHKHLVVRAEIENPPMGTSWYARWRACRQVVRWMEALIKRIGMKTLYGPKARYCAMPGNRGMTAFAIIETSHIVVHVWDECEPGILQLDVYTCSELEVEDVLAALDSFAPSKVEWKFLDREHELTLIGERRV